MATTEATKGETAGDTVRHRIDGVGIIEETPYWDDDEIVEVEIREGNLVVRIEVSQAASWLSLRWPEHFRRDGTCCCPAEAEDAP